MMIHPTSIISKSAVIESDVSVGPFTIIYENTHIKSGTSIGSHCEIGVPTNLAQKNGLKIGKNSNIRSHSIIYDGSNIGPLLKTGHHICIRENSIIGEGVQLGSRTDIQGDCKIGSHTKMHADVHIGKFSNIGSYVWLFPEVLLTNDAMPPSQKLKGPIIEDYCVLSSKVLVMPGIKISNNSLISASSVVKNNIDEYSLASGNPAKRICDVRILRMPDNPKIKAYPWRFRFHKGYPDKIITQWTKEQKLIQSRNDKSN